MCFSAPVSFAASGFLTAAGIASMRKAEKHMRFVAAIPFFFAAQQFLEGMQWLAIHSGQSSQLLAYAYLFFAFLFWPVYIPVTAYLNEKNKKRKGFLKYFIVAGSATSLYILYSLFSYPLFVQSGCCGIGYGIDYPFYIATGMTYVLIVVGSLLFSTNKYFKMFSLILFVSAFFSWYVFTLAFTSIWCFSAAVLSILIGLYFYKDEVSEIIPQDFMKRIFPKGSV